jgi:hypothetical protein
MNNTSQNFETHSTLGQHKTHIKRTNFPFNFISKDCLSCVEFEISFGFTTKIV